MTARGSKWPGLAALLSWVPASAAKGCVATVMAVPVDHHMALRDAKDHQSEVVDQVDREHRRVVITKHGRPAAAAVSVDDLESLEETQSIMSRPHLLQQVRDSLAELDEGDVLTKDQARLLLST